IPWLGPFAGGYVEGGTTVGLPHAWRDHWPGCGGGGHADEQGTQAAIKFQVRLDYCTGRLTGPLPGVATVPDQRAALPLDDLPAVAFCTLGLGVLHLVGFP